MSWPQWNRRGRSYRPRKGCAQHILILWIKVLTLLMLHDHVRVSLGDSHLPNIAASCVSLPSASVLRTQTTTTLSDAYLTINSVVPSCVTERIHICNPALTYCQIAFLWQNEGVAKCASCVDLRSLHGSVNSTVTRPPKKAARLFYSHLLVQLTWHSSIVVKYVRLPWRRKRLPSPVFWPGEFHGLYSPWSHKESDTTERISLCTP